MKTILLLLLFSTGCFAQRNVQGIIKNAETKAPIEYVMVIGNISGKTTVTNSEGRFQMNVSKEDSKLIFKHLDYFTKEMNYESNKTYHLELTASSESLDEIVILSIPIRDELMKAIKTSQANFAKNLKLNTYYRELLYINGAMYQYEDAELDYYLQSINKSNTIVKNSRSIKFTNNEAKNFDSLSNIKYYWGDFRERVSHEFDFKQLKNIISDKEYDMYITRKKGTDGTDLNVLNFAPADHAKQASLNGTVTYGKDDYLIREIKISLAPNYMANLKFNDENNHRFKRNYYQKTTLFSIFNKKYSLTYSAYRIFGISEAMNQLTKVGGFVELLVDSVDENFTSPNKNDFYSSEKLTRLGKNYKTKYWQKFNVVPLSFKEEQMLKKINNK